MAATIQELYQDAEEERTLNSLVQSLTASAISLKEQRLRIEAQIRAAQLTPQEAMNGRDELLAAWCELIAKATHGTYTSDEVQGWFDRLEALGSPLPQIGPTLIYELVYHQKTPNVLLREFFEEQIMKSEGELEGGIIDATLSHLRVMEEEDKADYGAAVLDRNKRDAGRELKTWLGLLGRTDGHSGETRFTLFISYERAVALALALGMTPQEAGI